MDNSTNNSGPGRNLFIILGAVAIVAIVILAMTTGGEASKQLVSEDVQPATQNAEQAPATSETAPNLAPAAGGTAADHKNLPADSETSED